MTVADARPWVEPRDHIVRIYTGDDQLVTTIGRYLADAVRADETALVIATPGHVTVFEKALAARGIDVAVAHVNGNLITLDARAALSRFMVDGWPDAGAFRAEFGGLIERADTRGRRVHVYGEMVALLWNDGHVAAAIELEVLWNQLGQQVPFSLFCAYAAHTTIGDDEDSFHRICNLHSAVVVDAARHRTTIGASDGVRHEEARFYRCGSQGLTAARQFVVDTLKSWGLQRLVDDVSIVESELATNAVIHARSDFVVTLSAGDTTVRVSVHDSSPVLPVLRDPPATVVSGRGLMLVASIAQRWGIEPVSDGKVVWAEFRV